MAAVLKQTCILRNIFRNSFVLQLSKRIIHKSCQRYSKNKSPDQGDNILGGVLSKYEPFKDSRSPIIMDVEEERRKVEEDLEQEVEEYNQFQGISPERKLNLPFKINSLL